nr:MAG TPA: hypothetical protein [Caudoviricetes sp.]
MNPKGDCFERMLSEQSLFLRFDVACDIIILF